MKLIFFVRHKSQCKSITEKWTSTQGFAEQKHSGQSLPEKEQLSAMYDLMMSNYPDQQVLSYCLLIVFAGSAFKNSGSHGLFLLLDLGAVQLCDLMLDLLDGRCLVHRLNVHGDNLAGLHLQEILQHLVAEVGGRDLQVRHGAVQPPSGRSGFSGRQSRSVQ